MDASFVAVLAEEQAVVFFLVLVFEVLEVQEQAVVFFPALLFEALEAQE